jgi:S1-C subfamily serine protease
MLIIVSLVIASNLKAQTPPRQPNIQFHVTPQPACVKVLVKDKDGRSGGTGALIGNQLVITCHHVVKDRNSSLVEVLFPNWRLVTGNVLAVNKKLDLALIELSTSTGQPLSLSSQSTWKAGDKFTIMGYGYGPFKAQVGSLHGSNWGIGWKLVNGAKARSGDSGGPVLDSEGRYAGTLWGSNDDGTYFTPVDAVVEFVRQSTNNRGPTYIFTNKKGK